MDELLVDAEVHEAGGGIDLARLMRGIWERRWLVVGITFVLTALWVVYLKRLPVVYEAECLVQFKDSSDRTGQLLNETRLTQLTSRTFAEEVVQKLGLAVQLGPEMGELRRTDVFSELTCTRQPWPGQYEILIGDSTFEVLRRVDETRTLRLRTGSVWKILNDTVSVAGFSFRVNPALRPLPQRITLEVSRFDRAVKNFRNSVDMSLRDPGTVLSLKVQSDDPRLAAFTVNRLAEIFVDRSISLRYKNLRARRELLEKQLEAARDRLEQAKERLKNFRQMYAADLAKASGDKFVDRDKMEQEIEALENLHRSLSDLVDRAAVVGRSGKMVEPQDIYLHQQLVRIGDLARDPRAMVLAEQVDHRAQEYLELRKTLPATNPDVRLASARLDSVFDQIREVAEGYLRRLTIDIQKKRRELSVMDQRIYQVPQVQAQLSDLERDLKVSEELYTNLQIEVSKARIEEAAEEKDVEILDPAIPPEYPINANKKKRALIGLMFSFAIGVGVAGVLELLDPRIKTVEDARRHLGLPVLGVIPLAEFDDVPAYRDDEKIRRIDRQLVTDDYRPTPISEAYRSLRTNLVFSKTHGRIHTLVLTSLEPGDGKSFTAANLAIIMAQQRHSTLLVDADLRRGVLHNTFLVPKEPGLTNYLSGAATLNEVLRETHVPNLKLVTCGPMFPNPSELLGSPMMKRFLDEVGRRFDFIVFDTPPLAAATDAIVLGAQVDGVALVVRAKRTSHRDAKRRLGLFANVPVKLLGVVINGATQEFGHEAYSYYHY
ncbi:MAG: polysaccharide biosynthesis tyrosine autokinase [candidate division KSB1 bacterium]|nr:polysaccharide biosynthesis tyrosine autokinase [candidate division KSB1 bacterium]